MSNYPSDMNQADFDKAHDEWNDFIDENPPGKIYLLNCGHFGPIEFDSNGEQWCWQCFDEFNKIMEEAIEAKRLRMLEQEQE